MPHLRPLKAVDTSPHSQPSPSGAPHPYSPLRRFLIVLLSLSGISFLLYLDGLLGEHAELPLAGEGLNYGLLFMAGLFTGFHCVGMCGALVVSYTVNATKRSAASYLAHLVYAVGKTLSYAVIGALFGTLGAIVTFTPLLRGVAGIAAGSFLLLFGLGMLNVFSGLSRLRIKTPGFLLRIIGWGVKRRSHPFVIGLLNGMMIICGPLQAMYIMAAGTGSPSEGAKLLFMFGLGTLPVMLGFGVLTSALSARIAPKLVRASGVIVIALGAIMLNRGLAMTGSGYDFNSLAARWPRESVSAPVAEEAQTGIQVIRMRVTGKGYEPNQFSLHKGMPVKWIIEGQEVNYCNHRITLPSLNLEFDIQKGENIIEFVPQQVGVVTWSCWMGMVPGVFLVHEAAVEPVREPPQPARTEPPREHSNPVHEWLDRWVRRLRLDAPILTIPEASP